MPPITHHYELIIFLLGCATPVAVFKLMMLLFAGARQDRFGCGCFLDLLLGAMAAGIVAVLLNG